MSGTNQRLRALLTEAGWRPETFAKRILDHGRRQRVRISLHDKTPYHWLRNGQCPRDPIPLLAAMVLSEQLGRSVTPVDLGWPATRSGTQRADDGLATLWSPGGAILGLQEVSASMHRRGFLVLTGSALTAVAHQWMVSDAPGLAAALDGDHVDDSLVADFERMVDVRRRMYDELGGGALYDAVTTDLRLVSNLLSNATYPEAVGRRLYGVAAELARMAGWSCHDTGHEGAAQRYWLVGLRAANEAQDKALGANVLAFMGLQATHIRSPQDSITIFSSARNSGGSTLGATQQAAIAAWEARAHAGSGDTNATASKVDEAFTLLDQSRPDNDPPWIYWCTIGELAHCAGSAFLEVGDPRKAVPHLQTAVDQLTTSCARDRASSMTKLATAHLRNGDQEQALANAYLAVDIAAGLTSNRVKDRLAEFGREATSTMGNQASAEFTDHARTALKA